MAIRLNYSYHAVQVGTLLIKGEVVQIFGAKDVRTSVSNDRPKLERTVCIEIGIANKRIHSLQTLKNARIINNPLYRFLQSRNDLLVIV